MTGWARSDRGSATLIGGISALVLTVLLAVATAQAVLVGVAVVLAGSSAREAARLTAVGGDPAGAVEELPPLWRGRLTDVGEDRVGVTVSVPTLLPGFDALVVSGSAGVVEEP